VARVIPISVLIKRFHRSNPVWRRVSPDSVLTFHRSNRRRPACGEPAPRSWIIVRSGAYFRPERLCGPHWPLFRDGWFHGLDLAGRPPAPEINGGHVLRELSLGSGMAPRGRPKFLWARAEQIRGIVFKPDRRPRQEAVIVSRCLLWKSFP